MTAECRVQIAGYTGPGDIITRGIRVWTDGPYSHTELVVDRKRWYSSSFIDGGVRMKEINPNPLHWDIMDIPWADADQIERHFDATKHLKYGTIDLITQQVMRVPVHDGDAVFCSEWCAQAMGLPRGRSFNPNDLMVLCAWVNTLAGRFVVE